MIGIDMKNTDELKKIDRKVEAKVKGATAVLFYFARLLFSLTILLLSTAPIVMPLLIC